jgi:hypothetical protein
MELGRCANLLRLSLEGLRQREESSLRSLRPLRLSQRVHFLESYTCEVSEKASWLNFRASSQGEVRRIALLRRS